MVNLKELVDNLKREHVGNLDVLAAPSEVDISNNGRIVFRGETYSFTQHSYKQWCNKLGLPHKFLMQCPRDGGQASQKAIFDHFRQTRDGEVLFRLRKGQDGKPNLVRAVLPGNYNVLDNDELLMRLSQFVNETGMRVEDAVVRDGNIDLKLLHPNTINIGLHPSTHEPDTHKFGFFIRNSEVGTISDIRGNFLVFRDACTNGMVFSSKLLGPRNKQPLLSTSHLKVDADLVTDLETSFARFEVMAPRAKDALEEAQGRIMTVVEAERALNGLLDMLNVNDGFDSAVAREFRKEPTMTRFGLAQALTAAARTTTTRIRSRIEAIAGDFILGSKS